MANSNYSKYQPLIIVILTIFLSATMLEISWSDWDEDWSWMRWMRHFMGLFLVTFAMFKLFNVRGFAEGFQKYDLIASAFPFYGLIYPLIEFVLGLAYLSNRAIFSASIITAVIMFLGFLGVVKSIQQKMDIQCACLGTVLNVPLSWVTLAENLIMFFMALGMLYANPEYFS